MRLVQQPEQTRGELRGLGHKANMAARKLDYLSTEALPQFHADLVAGIPTRFPPGHRYNPIRVRFERVEIEGDCRILPQLMFEPVRGISTRVWVVRRLPRTGHGLPV
jgi:hypothetical protein